MPLLHLIMYYILCNMFECPMYAIIPTLCTSCIYTLPRALSNVTIFSPFCLSSIHPLCHAKHSLSAIKDACPLLKLSKVKDKSLPQQVVNRVYTASPLIPKSTDKTTSKTKKAFHKDSPAIQASESKNKLRSMLFKRLACIPNHQNQSTNRL